MGGQKTSEPQSNDWLKTVGSIIGAAAAGYASGSYKGAGEDVRSVLAGLGIPGEKKLDIDWSPKSTPDYQTFFGGPILAKEIDPVAELPPEIAPPDMAPMAVQPVQAIQIMPGVNAVATPLEEVDPTEETIWDLMRQPTVREVMTPEGKSHLVYDNKLNEMWEEAKSDFFTMSLLEKYPHLINQGPVDSVEMLVRPLSRYEEMVPQPEMPADVVHKPREQMDNPRISDRLTMNGQPIELGSLLDQAPALAGPDDEEAGDRPKKGVKKRGTVANRELYVDDHGLTLLEEFEGREPYAYNDGAGYMTIGVGHRLTDDELASGLVDIGGQLVSWKQGLTEDQIDHLAAQDLSWAMDAVRRHVTRPLNQGQFNALTSFVFNIGETAFSSSGALKALNAGDETDFLRRMQLWNKAAGSVMPGLQKRRAYEAALWSQGI